MSAITETTPASVVRERGEVPPPPPARGPIVRSRRTIVFAAIGVLLAAAAITVMWPVLFPPRADSLIRASGRIEGREVTLAAKGIQGRVTRLDADEGQTVAKGQLLAELDVAQVEAQVAAARATVATLDAQVRQASLDVSYTAKNSDASILAADAAVNSAQAHATRAAAVRANAAATFARATELMRAGAISKQDLDLAETGWRTSEADVTAAEKDVARAMANAALARASADTIGLKREQLRALEQSQRTAAARLDEAGANFAERLITAPVDGTIVSRVVEVGDVVTTGAPLFQLIDMSRLYVKVYVPEPDIGKLRLGDPAEIVVDAFPGRTFAARISRVYDQAEFTPKNVETAEERLKLVFGVELTFVNPDGVLKPGMPVDCTIHWTATRADGRHGS